MFLDIFKQQGNTGTNLFKWYELPNSLHSMTMKYPCSGDNYYFKIKVAAHPEILVKEVILMSGWWKVHFIIEYHINIQRGMKG